MKSLKLISILLALFMASTAAAQITVTATAGSPPPWGPAGYTQARYYYLPDVEAFYDIQASQFIYNGGGIWVRSASLPAHFSGYDLYGGYKVVMSDYKGRSPYIHFKLFKSKYAKGYRGPAQKTLGVRPGNGNQKGNAHPAAYSNKTKHLYQGNHKSSGGGHAGGHGKKK